MNPYFETKAIDLFYDKYGKTPLEADLPVIIYDHEAGGFFYSTSEKKIQQYSQNREWEQKILWGCLTTTLVTGLFLIIFIMIMLYRDPELCLLLSKIWGFFGLGISILALIFLWIKEDKTTVFIPFEAQDDGLNE